MNICPISISLLIVFFLIIIRIGSTACSAHFTGNVSINCGSTRASVARNGRQWLGDVQPKLSSLLQISGKSTTSTLTKKLALDDQIPHKTARISRSPFSYTFQVDSGQKIIRLHFNPSKYKDFRGFKDLFTVQSGSFTLLSNFSASLTSVHTFAKEFCLSVQRDGHLTITFLPETSQSLNTYAFVNGIEIAPVPTALSYFDSRDIGLQVIGEKSAIYIDNDTALEIIQRQNIQQSSVLSHGDLDTMFPKWAIREVEKEKSSAWKIPVNVGFRYLVRLHFSEVGLKISGTGELKFKVLINEITAQSNNDILTANDGNHPLLYRDYIVMMRGRKTDGKRDILISILSYDELRYEHGILAGYEIVKLSNPDNSLASPNPLPLPQHSLAKSLPYLLSLLGRINAITTVAIALISLVNIIVYKLPDIWEASSYEEEIRPSDKAERLFRQFSLREIQLATEDFYEGHVIGKGGFGKVYKGLIDKGDKAVAVKRLKSNSNQGAREFLTEIEALSQLQHINLVSLIGYCREKREMILVYEYMPNGTFGDHLYKNLRRNRNYTSLTWKQRLNICIEAGRGLDYLHTGHRVIHHDVKASNILLDENFIAKVSDFGLAKPEDRSRLQSHVSTKVKGTFGYLDPYYLSTQKLTRKSDTYAFGVVLFETLCGRPAVDSRVPHDERILTTWVRDKISKGEVEEIVDPSLRQEILLGSLKMFVEVAKKCLHDEPKNRPTMSQVVLHLESALEQQDNRNPLVQNEVTLFAISTNAEELADENIKITTNEDIKMPAENAEELSEASADLQTAAFPLKSPAASKVLTKLSKYNPFRVTFWRRGKPKEFNLAPAILEADTDSSRYDVGDSVAPAKQYSDVCRHFSLHEVKTATRNFDKKLIIGTGRSSKVYKGLIDDSTTAVAIKRLNLWTIEVDIEFYTEITILSKLRHRNLVPLIGFCNEKRERALIYSYMPHGTLRDHLYGSSNPPLSWKRRLQICHDIAEGLIYLQCHAEQAIFHCSIKSANIFLDEEWVAKLHGFGLLEVRPSDPDLTSAVNGKFADLDKEYFMEQKLVENCGIRLFGKLLLEVLCAREQVKLVEWATSCFKLQELEQLVDSSLKGQIGPECLGKFVETAIACVINQDTDRPSMGEVMGSLEFAIHLQRFAAIDEELRIMLHDPSWTATSQFSFPNEILGAGIVSKYKAELHPGEVVTIKRFSGSFHVNQYRNEILLVPNLRHRSIIQLLRYYIDEQRGMLFYEYMENGSLEEFILDKKRREQLFSWSVRFKVIIGIAQGVSYLHFWSCPRIIHGDLNLSNILLDKDMIPKISGFGLARIIEDDQPESSTIADGTCRYTSQRCINEKSISEKEDVYRFGVLVLEIMSGQRNNEPNSRDHVARITVNALCDMINAQAWKLWEERMKQFRVLELIDRSLVGELSTEERQEALRCFLVALLCTQHGPQQRPTMESAFKMLLGEDLLLQEKMARAQCPPYLASDDVPEWLAEWPDHT